MSEALPASGRPADLLSFLDQLALLRDELRAIGPDPELIAEIRELLSTAQRLAGDLALAYPLLDRAAIEESGTRTPDPLTIAFTVGITTVVLPFVQNLVENAGDDLYRALTRLVRRRRAAKQSGAVAPDPDRIVLGDRVTDAYVAIDAGVDETAVAALAKLDLTAPSLRGTTLRWNPGTQHWDAEPGHSQVTLWLPGDPLEEDWNKTS